MLNAFPPAASSFIRKISFPIRPFVILCQMGVKTITPILHLSDIAASFAWFKKWGWKKCWDWGTPPIFGAVGAGESEIFLCQGAQGGRGKGLNTTTFRNDARRSSPITACRYRWGP